MLPTLLPDLPDVGKHYLPTETIHLGLDLQGGMHLVLEVETDKAVESTLERIVNDLKENLMDKRVRFKLREAPRKATRSSSSSTESRRATPSKRS